jgi:hypothetical protein
MFNFNISSEPTFNPNLYFVGLIEAALKLFKFIFKTVLHSPVKKIPGKKCFFIEY